MQLFGTYHSRATRNFWLADEMGITLDLVPAIQAYRVLDFAAPGLPPHTQSAEFLAMSPAGTVPVLKDGDLVLSESLAINLYLAKKTGGPLAPKDAQEEAAAIHWAMYGLTAIEPYTLKTLIVHTDKRRDTPAGAAEIADHTAALARPLKALDTHLARTGGYMVGGRFTVADINMAEVLRYGQSEPGLFKDYPAVQAWLDACQARPAFTAMMARRAAEPTTWG